MSEWVDPYSLDEGNEQRDLHLGRYAWANEMVKGHIVANAACSNNYGAEILGHGSKRFVVGFDRNPKCLKAARDAGRHLVVERDIQDETFHGFTSLVCLETFEHLERPWDFLKGISQTVREIVLSTPIIPTKHLNEWHLHDFTKEEVLNGLMAHGWEIRHYATQEEGGVTTYILIYATRK